MRTEMMAMILAGGRGTRLLELTSFNAKPAVYYGGKYRIIDFPLSNCANSNIDVVGILTQYESITLNSYVSQSALWGLDGRNKGTFVLPPREKDSGFGLYAGTADAIYQNIDFMDQYNPEYVLILSGDHIYKMNYDEMLSFHKEKNADLTIAGLTVTMQEAKRFGIMNTNSDNSIYEFEEKPEHPKNNLASMGIYIFNYKALKEELIKDHKDKESSHDFGKNIIPKMLAKGDRIFAYPFKGYWKDVGTVESLWQANMDLIIEENPLNLADNSWKIYTDDIPTTPQYVGPTADIKRSCINQGCVINGKINSSVLFRDCVVEQGAEIYDSVIFPNVTVKKGAIIRKCIVTEDLTIKENTILGDNNEIMLITSKEVK